MVFNNCVYIPDKIWNDIISPESKECVLELAMECHHHKRELEEAKTTIKELEQKKDDLQKALDKLEIIVRENNDMPCGFPATVGVKCYIKGRPYGLYAGFDKPELTVAEVVETANLLIEEVLGRWRDSRL